MYRTNLKPTDSDRWGISSEFFIPEQTMTFEKYLKKMDLKSLKHV